MNTEKNVYRERLLDVRTRKKKTTYDCSPQKAQKNLFGISNSFKKITRWVFGEKWPFFDLLDPSEPYR